MENASKALIIAGSFLITIMLISIGVYLFSRGKSVSDATTTTSEELNVRSFNAKFSAFETESKYSGSSYLTSGDNYLYASQYLNKIADVVSAVNLAYSVNYENNNSYAYIKNTGVETENAVEIIIDLGKKNLMDGYNYQYYLIEPSEKVEHNFVYGLDSLASSRSARIKNFNVTNKVDCYKLLNDFSDTKLINKYSVIYKYYFVGSCSYNQDTGKINSVKFTLLEDTDFRR